MASREFNPVFTSLPTTVFEKMSRLAAEHHSINLGQGFPDTQLQGPQSMLQEVHRSQIEDGNQYPPMMGVPALRTAIAAHSARHTSLPLDPATQVLITVGATEALAATFLSLLCPGDEAIVFTPLYDSYLPMIRLAGATPRTVTLHPPQWSIDPQELEAAFNPKTKLIVINTPHNPTGKVFTLQELQHIATLCVQYDSYGVLDEVYEHLVYPKVAKHSTMRALPGMEERCVRIGSAGKTFSFTDFKVGWVTGPVPMVAAIAKCHQFITFTVNSALQRAVAWGLDHEEGFYTNLGPLLATKRKYLHDRLEAIGFTVLPAQGTYFLVADFSSLRQTETETDAEFCFRLTREAGVTLIPVSAFYEEESTAPKTLVRFVFCKTDEKLASACDALEKYFVAR